jgi:hypothetical protein
MNLDGLSSIEIHLVDIYIRKSLPVSEKIYTLAAIPSEIPNGVCPK